MLAGAFPMNRNKLPSTRSSPAIGCDVPVQCFVSESVKLSVADHTLKYGSCTIRGVEGGRNCADAAGTRAAKLKVNRAPIITVRFIRNSLVKFTQSKSSKSA